jgi:type II secretory pathway pseudopilin PulG
VGAFTVTELLVVVGIVALLAATRLPGLCRAKGPSQLTQCQNNCRQMGWAVMLYRGDNNDAYPFGNRVMDMGTMDPTIWPMQLLRYLGGYQNVQPMVFLCPSERGTSPGWAFQVHYQANRMLVRDLGESEQPVHGGEVRNSASYWLFMEKGPSEFLTARPGALANPVLATWNVAPGSPAYRRHSGGEAAAAVDGHVEWLRMPPYRPGSPPPSNFGELGDCSNGQNPLSSWLDNGPRVKLYCRYNQQGF